MRPPAVSGFAGAVPALKTLLYRGKVGPAEAAVALRVWNTAGEAWTVEDSQLVAKDGEAVAGVRMHGGAAVAAGSFEQLQVVVAPSERVVPGTYTLRLKGGGRELVLENVTFK